MPARPAPPAARHPGAGRCAECADAACALRALLGQGGAGPLCAAPPAERALRSAGPWNRAPGRLVRYRGPTLAVALVAAGVAAFGRPLGTAGWAALAVAAGLALWWSAPRATPPGWWALLALAAAGGAAGASPGRSALWIPLAAAGGFGAARQRPAWSAAAGVLASCAWLAVATAWPAAGEPRGSAWWWPAAGPALAAALGAGRAAAARRVRAESESGAGPPGAEVWDG